LVQTEVGDGCGWIALESTNNKNQDAIKITDTKVLNVPDAVYGDVLNQSEWDRLLSEPSASACDLVIAHATSTPKGDLAEGEALLRHFPNADVRSTKYMFGHTLAASTILDVVVTRQAMLTEQVFTNGHDYVVDSQLDGLAIASNVINKPIARAAKISAAFGGALGLTILENDSTVTRQQQTNVAVDKHSQ